MRKDDNARDDEAAKRIQGKWSSDDPAEEFVVHNPATGHPIAVIQGAGSAQVDEAVRAAHTAQPAWRGGLLRDIASGIRENTE